MANTFSSSYRALFHLKSRCSRSIGGKKNWKKVSCLPAPTTASTNTNCFIVDWLFLVFLWRKKFDCTFGSLSMSLQFQLQKISHEKNFSRLDFGFQFTLKAQHQLYLKSALHSLFIPLRYSDPASIYAISVFRLFGSRKKEKKDISEQAARQCVRLHEQQAAERYSGVCKVSTFCFPSSFCRFGLFFFVSSRNWFEKEFSSRCAMGF